MPVISLLPSLVGQKQIDENRVIDVATIAQETGLTKQTVYTWLKGNLTRFESATIEAFCEYFQCDVGELLTVVDKKDRRANRN